MSCKDVTKYTKSLIQSYINISIPSQSMLYYYALQQDVHSIRTYMKLHPLHREQVIDILKGASLSGNVYLLDQFKNWVTCEYEYTYLCARSLMQDQYYALFYLIKYCNLSDIHWEILLHIAIVRNKKKFYNYLIHGTNKKDDKFHLKSTPVYLQCIDCNFDLLEIKDKLLYNY